jgi:hypothetical protein
MVKISITSKSSKLKVPKMPKVEKHNNLQQNIFPPVLTPKLRFLQSLGYYLDLLGYKRIKLTNLFLTI